MTTNPKTSACLIYEENIAKRNPDAKVIPICAKTGEGIDKWVSWMKEQTDAWIGRNK